MGWLGGGKLFYQNKGVDLQLILKGVDLQLS